MTPKVLGCGWAKTGTTSLGEALQVLGFRHQSQDLGLVAHLPVTKPILDAAQAESFDDWPWLLLFREFDEAFPDCRFVLTIREPQKWLASYKRHVASQGWPSPLMNEIREKLYGLKFPNPRDAELLERYERHNRDVQEHFAGRPGKLLVVNWEAGGGWPELCEFLGCPVPSRPFPKANAANSRRTLSPLARFKTYLKYALR